MRRRRCLECAQKTDVRSHDDEKMAVPAPAGPRVRVLAIDDEALLLSVMGRVLPDCDVVTSHDAREALAGLDADSAFDVILLDVAMPSMSGMAFFEALRGAHPALSQRVIFMSGGVFEAESDAFLKTVPNPRIAKPFRSADLRAVVAAVVQRAKMDR